MQKAYSWLHYRPTDFPVASRVASEIVSLPMFPQLTAEQQMRVAEEILAFTSSISHKPVDATGIVPSLAEQTT